MTDERERWLQKGEALIRRWCFVNVIQMPRLHIMDGMPNVASCAYYRDGAIWIYPKACALPGRAGRQWSWPGYTADRTPYGVLAHELGHHVDRTKYLSMYPQGRLSTKARRWTKEEPISGYCPDDTEWFAEMFRLFVTNPHLLRMLRPRSYHWFINRWHPVEGHSWRTILKLSPRHITAVENKLKHGHHVKVYR